jgi:arginase
LLPESAKKVIKKMTQQGKPVHIIGVPLDLGASRRGTDAGPSALRVAGLRRAIAKLGYEVTVESDIAVPTMETRQIERMEARFRDEILEVCRNVADTTLKTMQAGQVPLVIGGDHSIAMGTVSGVAAYYREKDADIGLIWFDAHGDMNLPGTSPSGNIHGMPLAHLLGHGDKELSSILDQHPAVKAENVVLIGIRDIDDHERKLIRSSGVTAFTMRDIDELGMTHVCHEALRIVNADTAGFHISREAHQLLENCADTGRMTSMEVVELNPFLDQENVSAERTVSLIQSAFGRNIL